MEVQYLFQFKSWLRRDSRLYNHGVFFFLEKLIEPKRSILKFSMTHNLHFVVVRSNNKIPGFGLCRSSLFLSVRLYKAQS